MLLCLLLPLFFTIKTTSVSIEPVIGKNYLDRNFVVCNNIDNKIDNDYRFILRLVGEYQLHTPHGVAILL